MLQFKHHILGWTLVGAPGDGGRAIPGAEAPGRAIAAAVADSGPTGRRHSARRQPQAGRGAGVLRRETGRQGRRLRGGRGLFHAPLRRRRRSAGPCLRQRAERPLSISQHRQRHGRRRSVHHHAPQCQAATFGSAIDSASYPEKLDVFWISQNYHDLKDPFMGPVDMAKFNKAVFDALKPGGVYIVLDHVAAKGSPAEVTDTLHRIEPSVVRREVEAAGFKFAGESPLRGEPGRSAHRRAVQSVDSGQDRPVHLQVPQAVTGRRPWAGAAACLLSLGLAAPSAAAEDPVPAALGERQQTSDAWWTGPLIANTPSTLAKGHVSLESYLFDVQDAGLPTASGRRPTCSMGSPTASPSGRFRVSASTGRAPGRVRPGSGSATLRCTFNIGCGPMCPTPGSRPRRWRWSRSFRRAAISTSAIARATGWVRSSTPRAWRSTRRITSGCRTGGSCAGGSTCSARPRNASRWATRASTAR